MPTGNSDDRWLARRPPVPDHGLVPADPQAQPDQLKTEPQEIVDSALLLGPVLRRVEDDRATIWVETRRPGMVEVRAGAAFGAARTFTAHGHHYGFVVVAGLPPAAVTAYEVFLDGERTWPPPGYEYPPPVIRTRPDDSPVRIVFCSCRESSPLHMTRFPPDALDAYAVRLKQQLRALADGSRHDRVKLVRRVGWLSGEAAVLGEGVQCGGIGAVGGA
jgi:hypothetical protein